MGVYVQVPTYDIVLEIPDFVSGDTILKRKAQMQTLTYNQKSKYFSMGWLVEYFENTEDGSYGEPIEANGINSYSRELVGDNTIMVDVATGDILVANPDGSYDVDYTGMYDYINNKLETTPVLVHDLIRSIGSQVLNW